jgi:hypothetical protein
MPWWFLLLYFLALMAPLMVIWDEECKYKKWEKEMREKYGFFKDDEDM